MIRLKENARIENRGDCGEGQGKNAEIT